ncbi:hypothetical protein D9M69_734810 [compost metagenome]
MSHDICCPVDLPGGKLQTISDRLLVEVPHFDASLKVVHGHCKCRQRLINLVGNACSNLAQGHQFTRLINCQFSITSLGDVETNRNKVLDLAIAGFNW